MNENNFDANGIIGQMPKLIAFDFDGVMTDNRVLVNQYGEESVFVSRSDGQGIKILKEMGLKLIIISTETNPVVTARARKIDIPVIQGVSDKGVVLSEYCLQHQILLQDVMYVGNDLNDLPAFSIVGYRVAPHDATSDIKKIAYVLDTCGGYGVVRELASILQNYSGNSR